MQPLRYITDVASTNTLSPSISKLLSIIPAPFSNCMEYEKPEHPPPTTPMRKPAGAGFCWAIISLTFETALAVRVIGAAFFTSGAVVVAIRISLALKLFHYSRADFAQFRSDWVHPTPVSMLLRVGRSHLAVPHVSYHGSVDSEHGTVDSYQGNCGFIARKPCKRDYNRGQLGPPPALAAGFSAPRQVAGDRVSGSTLLRWLMTPIEMIVFGLFGILAIGLIVLLIYRSTLTMHEDDQLFLDEANSHLQEEQTELLTKVSRLALPMRVFSIGSGVFLLASVALLIYQKLNEVQ